MTAISDQHVLGSKFARKRTNGRIVEWIIAVVLCIAASLKSLQFFHGNALSIPPGFLSEPLFRLVLIEAEFLLAAWLIVGVARRVRFACAIICFLAFAVVAICEAANQLPSCGCFGDLKIPPLVTALVDATFVLTLWRTRPMRSDGPNEKVSYQRILAGVVVSCSVSAVLWTGYFKSNKNQPNGNLVIKSFVVLNPSDWVGKEFPLLDEINGATPLRKGRWIILLYHYNCDSCLQAIPNYQHYAEDVATRNGIPEVAFVAMPPLGNLSTLEDSAAYLRLTLKEDHEWFAATPVAVAMEDGKVLTVAESNEAITVPVVSCSH